MFSQCENYSTLESGLKETDGTQGYNNTIHPSIHFLLLEPNSASLGEGGVTLDKAPVHHRAEI